jgi:hypothetical protein
MRLFDRLRRRDGNVPDVGPAPPWQHPQRDDWLDADPRRRAGAEATYGTRWVFDDPDDPYSLIWNPGSGELYTHRHRGDTVAVMGIFPTRAQVDALLANWEPLHDERFGGYMVCSRIAAHKAQQRNPPAPCYAVVARVDGTAEPFDQPLTYHDIQTVLGGVALTTADDQQPVGGDPLVAAYANTIYLDRNAHRDLKPVNDAATSLHGGRWPIRGDAVITACDQVPLDRSTVDMLLELPRPPEPTALVQEPHVDIATIPHGEWIEADPRRRQSWETRLARWPGGPLHTVYEVMYNRGSDELYLLHRRTGEVEVLGMFKHEGHAGAVVHDWRRHRDLSGDPDNPAHLSWLRNEAALSSISIDRDVDHDADLATYAQTVATEHDFSVQFNVGRLQPVRFRFSRPGIGTHLGRSFTVTGPFVEPASRADIDDALTEFLDDWSPDKHELDPDWAEAEADYIADSLDWMHRQLEGEGEPDYIADEELGWVQPLRERENDADPGIARPDELPSVEAPETHRDAPDATTTTDPPSAASPARLVVTRWNTPATPPAGPDRGLGGIA